LLELITRGQNSFIKIGVHRGWNSTHWAS
jgi:hypothetical protein